VPENPAVAGEPRRGLDESVGEVDRIDVEKVASKLERRSSDGAPDVEAAGPTSMANAHDRRDRGLRTGCRKVWHTEAFRPVVKLEILGDRSVGLVELRSLRQRS
jgi:hypothetical protein